MEKLDSKNFNASGGDKCETRSVTAILQGGGGKKQRQVGTNETNTIEKN